MHTVMGFVHRDIKPQNILLTNNKTGDMVAKLGDFGLAKNFQEAGNSCFTRTGETMRTLLFMAPEQLINFRLVKPPADLYSVGVTLYYFLTAKYPYNLSHRHDPIQVILEEQPVPILDMNSDSPPSLAAVVDKSIRKKPDQRFQTATELREAIQSALP